MSNAREIADTLFISVPTVRRHVTTILARLDLPSLSAATACVHANALT
jgi:DNA-binding NarL/FixJ family response regulator